MEARLLCCVLLHSRHRLSTESIGESADGLPRQNILNIDRVYSYIYNDLEIRKREFRYFPQAPLIIDQQPKYTTGINDKR